jgi:RimJ/RimL family protein N-acetyltransferase
MALETGALMYKVETSQYDRVAPLLQEMVEHHLSVAAVCSGTAPGEVWVDTIANPSIAFVKTPEGEYLAGDVACEQAYPALKALIPEEAYLTVHPSGWGQVLPQIWNNPVARRHPRLHLRWQRHSVPNWRALLPQDFELVVIDEQLLARTDLLNHNEIADRMDDWLSTDFFLQHGFGFCVLHGNTIVSRCIADCVHGAKCEIGVGTDSQYRRQGLALVVVAATVEHCLSRGFTDIGWHCLRSNTASRVLAEKAGFGIVTEYSAYSAVLPAENTTDLTLDEYTDWALHYETFATTNPWYRLFAAEAWALAGESARALRHLELLVNNEWHRSADWLSRRWALQSLRDLPEFRAILMRVRNEPDTEVA